MSVYYEDRRKVGTKGNQTMTVTKKQLILIIISAVLLIAGAAAIIMLVNPALRQSSVRCEFEAQYIRTGGGPNVRVINSMEELHEYTEAYFTPLGEGETPEPGTFRSAVQKYDESYFKEQVLILVTLEEPSGSIRHEVTSVERTKDGKLAVSVDRLVPQVHTDDMAGWHIIVEPEAGATVEYDTDVILFVDGEEMLTGERTVRNGYRNEANISVDIPEGWVYEITDYHKPEDGDSYLAISFRPESETEGWLTLKYINGAFDPAELGIDAKHVVGTADKYGTTKHYADKGDILWQYVTFTDDLPGTYVALNEGADAWQGLHGVDADSILRSAVFAEGLNRKSDIIDTAILKCDVDYDRYTVEYRDGRWYVYFYTADYCVPAQTVWIYSDSLSGFDGEFYF